MNRYWIPVITSLFLLLLVNVSYSGPNDIWLQCSTPGETRPDNFICCYDTWVTGTGCPVTFAQLGIPSETTWGVTVGVNRYTSTGSSVTVTGTGTVSYSYYNPDPVVPGTQYACALGCSGSVTFGSSGSNTVTATYQKQYTLTMSVNPAGSGITSPSTGTNWYDSGKDVPISATPISGYKFSSWTGSGTISYTGTSSTANIKMDSPISQTANFDVTTGSHCSTTVSHTTGDESATGNHRHSLSQSNIWEKEDCTTKLTLDTDGGDVPKKKGTVTDFTTCSQGACASQPFLDTCSGDTLTEYYLSGSSHLSKQYDCTTFGTDWTCSEGKCMPPPTIPPPIAPIPPPPTFDFSLSVSPATATITQGGSVESTATATLITGSQTVGFSCVNLPAGAICNFFPSSCTPTCSSIVTILTSATTPTGVYPITIRATAGSLIRDATYTLTVAPPCVYSLSMKNPQKEILQKTNIYRCASVPCENKWDITIQDGSANCGASLAYSIPSVSAEGPKCHTNTGVYNYNSIRSPKTEKLFPLPLSVGSGEERNAFTVFVKTIGTESCTLSFNFNDPAGNVVDPSFSVIPPGSPSQPPHVSIFEITGDVSRFDANWEAFYPDNDPERDMKVKCGLNCDPETSDCSAQDGKGCLPYDASQGADEIKKGGCSVPSPAYDFAATNKMICLFYDPADETLEKRVNHDFIPINFEIRAAERITTTVGQKIELKVDVANSGTLTDSYTITLAADTPEAVDISPSTVTTGDVSLNKITSAFFSIRPVVDTDNRITVTVSSNANPSSVKTWEVVVTPGLYALPEFGLVGFLQIIAIATIVYFLFGHRNLDLKKRRKRR